MGESNELSQSSCLDDKKISDYEERVDENLKTVQPSQTSTLIVSDKDRMDTHAEQEANKGNNIEMHDIGNLVNQAVLEAYNGENIEMQDNGNLETVFTESIVINQETNHNQAE